MFISHTSGSLEVRSCCMHSRFWWDPFSGLQRADFFLCPHIAERELVSSLFSSNRVLIPFMRVPFLRPNYLPMAALPSTLGFGFQHSTFRILRRQKHSVYLKPFYTVHLHICPQGLSSPNTTICLDRKWGDHQRGQGEYV